ncbi:hypothetical protein DTO271G3_4767 [Paecilomyces variotii]|nr:hypothetical protein DTO271G3_4767 [Paecilomyces variotii]
MYQQQQQDDSPPRTPRYKPSSRGHTRRPSLRDAFPEAAMYDSRRDSDSDDERDPHDLALSPKHVTRTSIVDNMLLSLDQFSSGFLDDSRFFGSNAEPYNLGLQFALGEGRHRGHTFSSSMSSDADVAPDDGPGRRSSQSTRGHRSNSSSNYQPGLKRIDSLGDGDGTNSRGRVYDSQRVALPGERTQTSRSHLARKSSTKSNASSNIDFAQMIAGSRIGQRRSASFDFGSRLPFIPLSESMPGERMLADDLEAAPTPTVPAGPRRNHDIPGNDVAPLHPPQAPRTPAMSRRNSIKSAKSNNTKKGRSEAVGTPSVKARDNDFKSFQEALREPPPPIPDAYANPPAPSPTISYNKPFIPPADPAPTKERPGFFRRVFGSSKNLISAQYDNPYTVESPGSQQESEPRDLNPAAAVNKGWKQNMKQPSTGGNTPTRETGQQVINKKPSFFRRRKKSVADVPLPVGSLPQNALKPSEQSRGEPSMANDLRKTLGSYLIDGSSAVPGGKTDSEEEFLADSTGGDVATDIPTQKARGAQRASASATKGPVLRTKYSLNLDFQNREPLDSFLHESSGNEDLNDQPGCTGEEKTRRPSTSPVAPGHMFNTSVDVPLPPNMLQSRESFLNGVSVGKTVSVAKQPTVAPADDQEKRSPVQRDFGSFTERPDEPTGGPLSIDVLGDSSRASMSDVSNYVTASNTPVISEDPKSKPTSPLDATAEESTPDGKPSPADYEIAQKVFDNQDRITGNEPAAAWLGHPDRAMVRKAYMELYDWSDMNILSALRSLCTRTTLKGETQQVDRVLDAFSSRWCECNPCHGFKAPDVVHTICYSLLLLNTDLHVADIEQKMTKAQFVRNTMPTIHRVAMDAAPESFDTIRASTKSRVPLPFSESGLSTKSDAGSDMDISDKRASKVMLTLRPSPSTTSNIDPGPLVNVPFTGTMRAWEVQVEAVLKDFYSSIQKQRLPLYGADPESDQSNNFLGPNNHGLRRTPSTLSKSGSDIYPRGRSVDSRSATARWPSSKPNRSRGGLYPRSAMGSRTSLDDQSSFWSPSASSTWSKYSLGKTLTSMSVDSLGSDYPRGEYQQSIGFANALSQAIIREDSSKSITSIEEFPRTTPLLEDETLELAGAPWAKEGNLKHKHHLDAVDKKAKDRNWNECFAVIQQGWMRLFSFNASTKSMRQKKARNGSGIVGGGNWMENAEEVWKFLLRQTIASALPPPGYSKSRPHVWALSLPTGAVHLFQAGTPEIVKEFVTTANYWSARLSKEPLIGGVSNIEYGWSDSVINSAVIHADTRSPPGSAGAARPSLQSSIRSSLDQQGVRPKLPADRVTISDWAPPQQSMVASNLPEEEQLNALQNYVKNVEAELQKHNELRPAMILAFSPKHPNAAKAMANWERKSSYLLREIVKFRTYIDCLRHAQAQKAKIYAEREGPKEEEAAPAEAPEEVSVAA